MFVRFDGRRAVVVGGGAMAAAKIPALLAAGADVTVIAPHVSAAIDRARVRVVERAFVPADLDGAWFVTAAATPEVNRAVRDAAEARAVFVNAVDDPANATAYLGGAIARGGVTVAFSTSGRAPALAGLLREAFDDAGARRHRGLGRPRPRTAQPAARRGRADGRATAGAARRAQPPLRGARAGAGRGRRSFMSPPAGFVSLVGAGPGDPDHLTFKAARRLREADLVLYDALVTPEVLALAARADHVFVGKRAGHVQTSQAAIHEVMIAAALPGSAGGAAEGRRPVRVRPRVGGSAGAAGRRRALRSGAGRVVGGRRAGTGRHPAHPPRHLVGRGRAHRRRPGDLRGRPRLRCRRISSPSC